ncbi:hypothetical protein A8L34_24035 [Bacillus sp. FJAT-27264]|nr:hypothetical protein A8L34_24035 [Bacillus sp. FJAT-27264]
MVQDVAAATNASFVVNTDSQKYIVGGYVSDGNVSWVPNISYSFNYVGINNPESNKPNFPVGHVIANESVIATERPGFVKLTFDVYGTDGQLVTGRTEVFAHSSKNVTFYDSDPQNTSPQGPLEVNEGFSSYTVNGKVSFLIKSNNTDDVWSLPLTLYSGGQEIYESTFNQILDSVAIGFADGDTKEKVTQNLTLPTTGDNGTSISWESSDPDTITPQGVVHRTSNEIPVTLTAKVTMKNGDGWVSVNKKFNVVVSRGLSNVSTLDILELDNITIDPLWNSNVYDYTANVPASVTATSVTYETMESEATAQLILNDSPASNPINLNEGENVIKVIVTAEDGSTQAYSITVNRAAQPTPVPSTTPEPTVAPTPEPTPEPTATPTPEPTVAPTPEPTTAPTPEPTTAPTTAPTPAPTTAPTPEPTTAPTPEPTTAPTVAPTPEPTTAPTTAPTTEPTTAPTTEPTTAPTIEPTTEPTPAATPEPPTVPATDPPSSGEQNTAPVATPTPTPVPIATPTVVPTASPIAPESNPFSSAISNVGQLISIIKQTLESNKDAKTSFPDTSIHWAANDIALAVRLQIITSYQDGSFKPNAPVSRGEFSAMIVRAFHLQAGKNSVTFKDLAEQGVFKAEIELLATNGIISGYQDGTFGSNKEITRAEMLTMISRILNLKALNQREAVAFADISNGYWAKQTIEDATIAGLVNGVSTDKFAPEKKASRAEVASLILRSLKTDESISKLLQ